MKRKAVIVAVRNVVPWKVAVPNLIGYKRLYKTQTWRSSVISLGNCLEGFEHIIDAITDAEALTS